MYKQVIVEAGPILNTFIQSLNPLKNAAITMSIMVLQLCDRFSEGIEPHGLIDNSDFPRWEMFDWSYADSDKVIIRNAGLTLATALYEEFKSLGLVHQGKVPYITNRIENRSLIILDYMPY